MATLEDLGNDLAAKTPNDPRTKSSILRPFLYRRNNSDGSFLQPSASSPYDFYTSGGSSPRPGQLERTPIMGMPGVSQPAWPLGELQHNQRDQGPRFPMMERGEVQDGQKSSQKSGFATISLKSRGTKDPTKGTKSRENSPEKPKKTKSSTNLGALLSRPKSNKSLQKLAAEDEARVLKDKENRTPPSSLAGEATAAPPIYAQFCRENVQKQQQAEQFSPLGNMNDPFMMPRSRIEHGLSRPSDDDDPVLKQRPKSFQAFSPSKGSRTGCQSTRTKENETKQTSKVASDKKPLTWGKSGKTTRSKVLGAFGQKVKDSSSSESTELNIDEKDIDTHLEAMLDRRNIPENQRYKMRNLNNTIKMEFIRQDWAETRAKDKGCPPSHDSDTSMDGSTPAGTEGEQRGRSKVKHIRVKSLTFSKSRDKTSASPTKKAKGDGTLGRHFRNRSTDSIATDRPSSAGLLGGNGLFSKLKATQTPSDFVSYLQNVQKPEMVEVGKLHKLRLLLRNETVAWTEDFIKQGGMKEIVGLLHRIMDVEWREEHEDALLHENLLCLKALCTTALALQYLHTIQKTLLPALIHLIFDPEKKGPSEFTTRNIITSILFTYIESTTAEERVTRAQIVLAHLRDPEGKEEERPVSFVLEMRRERPYRVWCKEAVNVTKEVFWIFLHNLNIVALPAEQSTRGGQLIGSCFDGVPSTNAKAIDATPDQPAYMTRYFPQERAPVPAAPYVGGVEWDATNYLASHLDLMNAILACTPSTTERNALRAQLRISGWERCMGSSLRLCKEKFYGAVHDGLRTWVAAAFEDGWEVKDVRYGPPPEARSPPKQPAGGVRKKEVEKAPKIQMPKLDFQLGDSNL